MPSRSPSRHRTASPPTRRRHSPSPTPQRSVSPRSRTPSERAYSRPVRSHRADSRKPIRDSSPSRSRSRSRGRDRSRDRSRSRTRSYSRSRSLTPPRSSKIIIEKLTKNVKEEHLEEIFSSYGPIKHIDLPLNRSFGTNRGTAYVVYDVATDAETAIAHMHEAQLDGAVIAVSIVLPQRRFSRSPVMARRSPGPYADRDKDHGGYRGGRGGGYGGRYKSPPSRYRSPPRGGRGGREDTYGYGRNGGGYRGNGNDRRKAYSRSRSPRRIRSPSYDSRRSRSPSRTPPRPRGRYDSPPRGAGRGGETWGGRRRRSPSYSSYDSHGRSRTRSLSRSRYRR